MAVKSFVNENKEYRKCVPHLTIYALPTEEKKLRSQMLIDFAKLQGYEPDQLKRLEDVLARAKDMDEAISEFRRLKDNQSAASSISRDPRLNSWSSSVTVGTWCRILTKTSSC